MSADPIDDGGPAFPAAGMTGRGMSLRDYFAGQALVGVLTMVSTGAHSAASSPEGCAREAYALADAMLRERAK